MWAHFESVISHEFTFFAKRSEQRDSFMLADSAERLQNISVFESPPSEFCSRCVNFESRYGT